MVRGAEGTYDPQTEDEESRQFKTQDRRREVRGSEREKESQMSGHLQRCHVIEGMVQLLTNGLVLQLLSIQFIWRSEVDRKCRQVSRTAATQTSQKQDKNEGQMETKSKGRKEKTKKKQVRLLKMQKCLEERMMHI